MSALTRYRIKIIIGSIIIGIIIGVWMGFPKWWAIPFLSWLVVTPLIIIGGAWGDYLDRLKARDLYRYAVKDDPH